MKPNRMLLIFCLAIFSVAVFGQANGKLQIHYMDVGQGDGALLISPGGETVLFDNGASGNCEKPVEYLESLGITKIDYMIISHYHADHFGCSKQVLENFPLIKFSYDRPGAYNSQTFTAYVNAVGNKRKSVGRGTKIVLDAGSTNPVTINIAGYNGAGVPTENENDRSVVGVIHFGNFDAMMAGDLSGYNMNGYQDIETTVARRVGQMEVYKVNHHGSRYSSNPAWMNKLKPRIAIISAGVGNDYGHPTAACLQRLRAANVEKVYWTSTGEGADPQEGTDIVANSSIVVQFAAGDANFTVSYGTHINSYPVWAGAYTGRR